MGNNALSELVAAALLGRMQRPAPSRPRSSRYRPHQSTRECMRRIGGGIWEQFKRDDRIHRGLSTDKTTNGA